MLKMAFKTLLLPPLFFLCISGQQLLQISSIRHQHSISEPLQTFGVSVDQENLNNVSFSVLTAESWLRNHVLSRYPSKNITSVIVTNNKLCDFNQDVMVRLVVFAMKNVYHSLVRWGLEKKIKVSVSFTPKCFYQHNLKPVFKFLNEIDSTYTLDARDLSHHLSHVGIFSSNPEYIMDLSVFSKTSRKLLSEFDYSVPSDAAAAAAPLPPLIGVTPPEPAFSLPSPVTGAQPPYGLHLPPCNPYPTPHHGGGGGGAVAAPPAVGGDGGMAAPPGMVREELWCVAKPSVPSEKLQEAMDYACGEGGADCGPISSSGSCYFPDSVVAHASYAFNSYWQKNKRTGGTCGFGGTAMLISSDPSFLQCHFTLS